MRGAGSGGSTATRSPPRGSCRRIWTGGSAGGTRRQGGPEEGAGVFRVVGETLLPVNDDEEFDRVVDALRELDEYDDLTVAGETGEDEDDDREDDEGGDDEDRADAAGVSRDR